MYDWIVYNGYHPVIIATKLDKINRSQIQKHVKMLRQGLGMEKDGIIDSFLRRDKAGQGGNLGPDRACDGGDGSRS